MTKEVGVELTRALRVSFDRTQNKNIPWEEGLCLQGEIKLNIDLDGDLFKVVYVDDFYRPPQRTARKEICEGVRECLEGEQGRPYLVNYAWSCPTNTVVHVHTHPRIGSATPSTLDTLIHIRQYKKYPLRAISFPFRKDGKLFAGINFFQYLPSIKQFHTAIDLEYIE